MSKVLKLCINSLFCIKTVPSTAISTAAEILNFF